MVMLLVQRFKISPTWSLPGSFRGTYPGIIFVKCTRCIIEELSWKMTGKVRSMPTFDERCTSRLTSKTNGMSGTSGSFTIAWMVSFVVLQVAR